MRTKYLALLLFGLTLLSAPVAAQETTGQITGRIVDPQGLGIPGAIVTVSGPQGIKTSASGVDGRFTVPFLTPGTYSVRAQLQGFRSVEQKDVTVSLGQAADVSLKMQVGGVTETVQVTGAVSVVNTATTTIGAVLNTEQLAAIPVGRRVADVLYLAPGVSSSGTLGRMNPSISGGSGLENQYVVDGTNVTNAGYGGLGSYSIIFGSLGNATPYDFVKEIQVKTGGYEAEFGQSTGGVVNVITKSGTNNYRGSMFAYGQPTFVQGAVYAVPGGQRIGEHDRHRRSRTPASKSAVRSSRTACSSSARSTRRGRRPSYNAPPGLPAREPRRRRPRSPHRVVRGEGHGAAEQRAPHRRVVLRRSVARRHRSAAHLVAARREHPTPRSARSTTAAISRRSATTASSTATSSSKRRSRASDNRINELPSVNTWRITDQTVTPNVITGGIGFYEAGNESLNRRAPSRRRTSSAAIRSSTASSTATSTTTS